jgi:hypothetical protein
LPTLFFFCDLFKVLVNNGHGQHNTCATADGAHKVSKDAKSADANAAESRCRCDVAREIANHGVISEAALNSHVLLDELATYIPRGLARDVDPDAREDGAAAHHKHAVENEVEGVALNVKEVFGWRNVVSQASNGRGVASHIVLLPLAEEAHEEVSFKLAMQHLREEVQVGHEGGLQDDWDVGGVEELHCVGRLVAAHPSAGELQLYLESLEINHYKHNDDGRQQVRNVGSVLAPHRLLQRGQFVLLRQQEVE